MGKNVCDALLLEMFSVRNRHFCLSLYSLIVFFQAFVEAQNKLTVPFLEQCPVRGLFKERMTELYDYPKYSCHFKKGKRYVRNVFGGGDKCKASQNQLLIRKTNYKLYLYLFLYGWEVRKLSQC